MDFRRKDREIILTGSILAKAKLRGRKFLVSFYPPVKSEEDELLKDFEATGHKRNRTKFTWS